MSAAGLPGRLPASPPCALAIVLRKHCQTRLGTASWHRRTGGQLQGLGWVHTRVIGFQAFKKPDGITMCRQPKIGAIKNAQRPSALPSRTFPPPLLPRQAATAGN